VYGVIAFDVRQRADEIGVRMAVGAQRSDVARLVVRSGAPLIALGLAIGLAGSIALSSAVASMLHGISPLDPVAYALGTVVLAGVGLLACWLPATRATRIDPVTLLRYE
jgi:putative ABC transport system permease protein